MRRVNMNKKLALAALGLLAFPSPAGATDWVEVARSQDGLNVAWVDNDRIIYGSESTGFWLRLSLQRGAYVIALISVRCPSRTYMEIKKTYFEKNGTATTLDVTKEWEIATPDTMIDRVFDEVCK